MTTAAKALSPAEKKQLLKNPHEWVRQHQILVGKRTLSELLERRQMLSTSSEALITNSRDLSRQIGAAKKQGEIPENLLQQKRKVSASEKQVMVELKQLEAQLMELLAPPTTEFDDHSAKLESAESVAPRVDVDIDSLQITPLSPSGEAAWDEFVAQHPDASVYHLSGLRKVIAGSFSHETLYFNAISGKRIVGVLPLVRLKSRLFGDFMVSQPYFNYGGVLAVNALVAERLLSVAQQKASAYGCSHIEYRDVAQLDGLPVRTDKVAMWLDLPADKEQLWQQVGTKVRAQIKRSRRFGLTVQSGGPELLDDFYQVFAENMRDLGTPVYGKDFFANLLASGIGNQQLVIVRHQGKPVSAAYLVAYKQRMEVPWASTLRSANRFDANMFLYWELLSQACSQGCTIFDFGRSTVNAATYKFKKQWGAKPRQLYWHYWLRDGGEPPRINPDNPKYRLVISVWQKLPVWLTRLLGPGIVKYLP
jgi:FemAB-related protein (PEP-CTERM system-associated)